MDRIKGQPYVTITFLLVAMCFATSCSKSTQDPDAYKLAENVALRAEAMKWQTGAGGTYDIEKALELYKEAGETGDILAKLSIVTSNIQLFGRESNKGSRRLAEQVYQPVKVLAQDGDVEAGLHYALFLQSNWTEDYSFGGVEISEYKTDYLVQAVNSGFLPAFSLLGFLYTLDEEDPERFDKAQEVLMEGAELGCADAMYQLGYLHGQEAWDGHMPEQTVYWFAKAAEREYPPALWALGYCF